MYLVITTIYQIFRPNLQVIIQWYEVVEKKDDTNKMRERRRGKETKKDAHKEAKRETSMREDNN